MIAIACNVSPTGGTLAFRFHSVCGQMHFDRLQSRTEALWVSGYWIGLFPKKEIRGMFSASKTENSSFERSDGCKRSSPFSLVSRKRCDIGNDVSRSGLTRHGARATPMHEEDLLPRDRTQPSRDLNIEPASAAISRNRSELTATEGHGLLAAG